MIKIIVKYISLAFLLALILLNSTIIKSEAKSDSITMKYRTNASDNHSEYFEDYDSQDDKNSNFRFLLFIIEQNLIKKYKKMDDLEYERDYMQLFESMGMD